MESRAQDGLRLRKGALRIQRWPSHGVLSKAGFSESGLCGPGGPGRKPKPGMCRGGLAFSSPGWKDAETVRGRPSTASGALRPAARLAVAEASTSRVVLPGPEALQRSRLELESWTCFPDLPGWAGGRLKGLRPGRQAAERLMAALAQAPGGADLEAKPRVLLMSALGCCLEYLGLSDEAASLFARCLVEDPGNPLHAYNRGAANLRLGHFAAACRDLDLAVSLCLAKNLQPPVQMLLRRALAGSRLPERQAEVWADFELARRRLAFPELGVPEICRSLAREPVASFAEYRRKILGQAEDKKHWAVMMLARTYGRPEESQRVTQVELSALLELLDPALNLQPDRLRQQLHEISAHFVPPGQPLLPSQSWFCLLRGELRVVRFAAPLGLTAKEPALTLEDVAMLKAPSSFWGALQGPQQDGWLVAAPSGATALRIPLGPFRRLFAGEKKDGGSTLTCSQHEVAVFAAACDAEGEAQSRSRLASSGEVSSQLSSRTANLVHEASWQPWEEFRDDRESNSLAQEAKVASYGPVLTPRPLIDGTLSSTRSTLLVPRYDSRTGVEEVTSPGCEISSGSEASTVAVPHFPRPVLSGSSRATQTEADVEDVSAALGGSRMDSLHQLVAKRAMDVEENDRPPSEPSIEDDVKVAEMILRPVSESLERLRVSIEASTPRLEAECLAPVRFLRAARLPRPSSIRRTAGRRRSKLRRPEASPSGKR
ncbi:unnamed protein product [Effrenium voratum]|uniref:Tetratricopeptide repeat protein n=1 Tax=Effrenium voratum TaxID=2562239 RepID=A0AA36JPR1_9DINO|nr:unnamed protein product [Effrenium voratum]